jgi:hypothetical protein
MTMGFPSSEAVRWASFNVLFDRGIGQQSVATDGSMTLSPPAAGLGMRWERT